MKWFSSAMVLKIYRPNFGAIANGPKIWRPNFGTVGDGPKVWDVKTFLKPCWYKMMSKITFWSERCNWNGKSEMDSLLGETAVLEQNLQCETDGLEQNLWCETDGTEPIPIPIWFKRDIFACIKDLLCLTLSILSHNISLKNGLPCLLIYLPIQTSH